MLEHANKLKTALDQLPELVNGMSSLANDVADGTTATLTDMNDMITLAKVAKQDLIDHQKALMTSVIDEHEYVVKQFDEFIKRAQVIVNRLNTKATT